jgi:hypothetical protein
LIPSCAARLRRLNGNPLARYALHIKSITYSLWYNSF